MVIKLKKTKRVVQYNNYCKSKSRRSGRELRKAHYELGKFIGNEITRLINKYDKVAVFILMRSGLPFGMGIADRIEEKCKDTTILFSCIDKVNFDLYDLTIIADAVINTGKTIEKLVHGVPTSKYVIAANVVSEKGCHRLTNELIYASRISKHSYKGSSVKAIKNGKGPDTGGRLFENAFFAKNVVQ